MDINDFRTTGSASDGNIVTIFTKKVINNFKSKEADELIYDFLPYLEIVSAGQRHSIVVRKIETADKTKYKEHWDAYEKKEQLRSEGTALRDWTGVEPEMVAALEYMNIFTVEDLSNVSDGNLQNIGMGANKLKKDAKLFVSGKDKNDVTLQKALDKIADLENKISLMGAEVAIPDVPKTGTQDDTFNRSTRQPKRNRRV
jgi:hypothetical protein